MNPWLIAIPIVWAIVMTAMAVWSVRVAKEATKESRCWYNSYEAEHDRSCKWHDQLQSAESKLRKISRLVQPPEHAP